MHEMSIALSIVDLADEQANLAHAGKIIEIELDIGTMSGVEVEALNFALEIAAKDTLLEAAVVKINRILNGKGIQVKSILVE
jgi:hydrogenase nickel incorporation protein HypA/HybF